MHVTVCICTRNRGASIAATLRSLIASTYTDFDVLIVDQSTADDTAQAVREEAGEDQRFSYLRSETIGKSIALNIGMAQALGPIIAFTDDDCEVSPEWLERLVTYFQQEPRISVICGPVEAVSYDPSTGHIPTFTVKHRQYISSPWQMWRAGGIGANMAIRKDALQAVGDFDEVLGPGGDLFGGVDLDMTWRLLMAGYRVLNVPDAVVIHSGFRPWDKGGKTLIHRAYIAIGAIFMKHLRVGHIAILPSLLYIGWFWCMSWKNVFLLKRSAGFGLRNVFCYVQGMRLSFRYTIDRQRVLYIPRQR